MANLIAMLGSTLSKRVDWKKIENEAVARADARSAATRFSRGNVAIQMDHFVTNSDLDKERAEVASIKFPD